VAVAGLLPGVALAFSLSDLFSSVAQAATSLGTEPTFAPDETVLRAALNIDPNPAKGGGDLAIAGGALIPSSGPEGTIADIVEGGTTNRVSIYVVRRGDSLAGIASMFGVSPNTILWANDLKSAADIHPGDTLAILPVSGIKHEVAKGETIASIVKKYKGDLQDVLDFNDLSPDATLAVGDTIVIPGGVDPAQATPAPKAKSGSIPPGAKGTEYLIPGSGGPAIPGYYMRPIAGGVKTQGLHGYNAVDLGTPVGTRVMAAAEGTVVIARASGYNGGYGEYVAIQHPNGTQTVYGHLSKVYVTSGEHVTQGETIALSGNTGRSTGPHLHFEVRGAANPF
jgi:murein DD-endopeptidase MepM/ murein hydrolase activator NlpD